MYGRIIKAEKQQQQICRWVDVIERVLI
jgi:hypothetical protein